ncbi:MAG: hypothetical protein V8T10_08910 [Merdibacter sp.]
MVEEQELRELNSEFAVRLSQLHEETDRRLMKKRNELTAEIFRMPAKRRSLPLQTVRIMLKLLKKQAAKLAQLHPHTGACLYVREEDMRHEQLIREAFAQPCRVEKDSAIRCGGIRLECAEEGIVIDDTFDNALAEEKDWFFRTLACLSNRKSEMIQWLKM